ncbi:MAG: insulinase family protein [Clostridia bacterium]|nr:insulinase family protein [Clostridia bacterium]
MKRTEFESSRLRERYVRIDHPSGLPIYIFHKPLTTAYAILSTRYGSVDTKFRMAGDAEWIETPDGVAHYLEHKLFENADGSDSFERFSVYGADANAYTTCNRTSYLFSCTEHFEESLEELLTFVTSPHFTKASVRKERGIIAEEIRMYDDNPWERCFQNLMEGLYERNPIRVNICGTEASIARITPEILYDCYRAFYQLSNMALIVCGDVTEEEVLRVADRVLPNVSETVEIERWEESEPASAYRRRVEMRMQTSKPIFSIGIKDVQIPKDPAERMRRDVAQSLLEEILFSRSGDFYNTLFEEGVITPSYSYGYSIAEGFAFHAITGECDTPELIEERLWQYLEQVKRDGIDREEFERCRRALYADEIRNYDSTEDVATELVTFVFDGVELFDYPAVIESLTLEELTALLDDMPDREACCLSVVYPLEDKSTGD